MAKVWESAPYSEGTLLALLALADWADDEGLCWPKVDQLAKKARLTYWGARYCLRKLIADGALTVERQSNGRGHQKLLRIKGQYLPNAPEKGAVNEVKRGSRSNRNKEEPSVTVKKEIQDCFSCGKPSIGKFSGVHVCSSCLGRVSLPNKPAEAIQ